MRSKKLAAITMFACVYSASGFATARIKKIMHLAINQHLTGVLGLEEQSKRC